MQKHPTQHLPLPRPTEAAPSQPPIKAPSDESTLSAAQTPSAPKSQSSKADFIRQHPKLSAAEIVREARKHGLTVKAQLVYKVRSQRRAKRKPSGRSAPPAVTRTNTARGMSASDFIRSHPDHSPNDLVAMGQRQGITFSRNLVYMVRGPRGSAGPGTSARTSARTPPTRSGASTEVARELAKLALAIGLDRAETVLAKLRSALG